MDAAISESLDSVMAGVAGLFVGALDVPGAGALPAEATDRRGGVLILGIRRRLGRVYLVTTNMYRVNNIPSFAPVRVLPG